MKTLHLLALVTAALFTGCATEHHTASQYNEMSYQSALRGDAAKSKAYNAKAQKMEPGSQWYRVGYGWCLFNLDRYPEALAEWKKAAMHDANGYRINACLALGYYKVGQVKAATQAYGRQVEIDRDFGRWQTLLETTDHWQPKEKAVLHAVYRDWRATR